VNTTEKRTKRARKKKRRYGGRSQEVSKRWVGSKASFPKANGRGMVVLFVSGDLTVEVFDRN